MVNYLIRQSIVYTPEVKLPEGSQVVSIKHNDEYEDHRFEPAMHFPEHWVICWLEPSPKQ